MMVPLSESISIGLELSMKEDNLKDWVVSSHLASKYTKINIVCI